LRSALLVPKAIALDEEDEASDRIDDASDEEE
jgi:hypothetical protein